MSEIEQYIRTITHATGALKIKSDEPCFSCDLTKVLQFVSEIDPAILFVDAVLPKEIGLSLHLIFWRKERPLNVLIINMGLIVPESEPDFEAYAREISKSAPVSIAPVIIDHKNYTRTIEICWCTRDWHFRLIEYSGKESC